jgi:hypothetical protein
MSKIDDYNKAKVRYNSFASYARDAENIGLCDKLGAQIVIKETYRGYYGNSSCGSWSDEVAAAVKAWMESHVRMAMRDIAAKAAIDMEKARGAAQEEAREILGVTAKAAERVKE